MDLIHLFYTSLNDELFNRESIETFVQYFYNELKELLVRLEFDLMEFKSLEDFQKEMTRKSFSGEN